MFGQGDPESVRLSSPGDRRAGWLLAAREQESELPRGKRRASWGAFFPEHAPVVSSFLAPYSVLPAPLPAPFEIQAAQSRNSLPTLFMISRCRFEPLDNEALNPCVPKITSRKGLFASYTGRCDVVFQSTMTAFKGLVMLRCRGCTLWRAGSQLAARKRVLHDQAEG